MACRRPTIGILVAVGLTLGSMPAGADSFYRGSRVSYRNAVSALSFDRSAELTYNPAYTMSLSLEPRFWIGDIFNIHGRFDISHELTDSDRTTERGETVPGDLSVSIGATGFYEIPVVGIELSADVELTFPTSPSARARTLMVGVGPGVRLSRTFDVLSGLTIGAGFRYSKLLHRYTTAERESPLIANCSVSPSGCDAYLSTGVRNASHRLTPSVDISLSFVDWLSFSAYAAFYIDLLHDAASDSEVSFEPQEAADERYMSAWGLSLTFVPVKPLQVAVGVTTVHPQLAPDSQHYAPFFNRFTTVFVDLRLDIAELVEATQ